LVVLELRVEAVARVMTEQMVLEAPVVMGALEALRAIPEAPAVKG